ncbi:restriction endonuclease subunit S [Ellagibacter isourolithinifaciens]|uniref:restriction endonuclease subunit S n=1 Tax=Ellagibacter isourolithinifaciens TaxID=2137581 RepID=UPI003A8CFCA6
MSWEKVKLNDICSSIYDGDHNAPPKSDTGVPFVTISNIDAADGSIDFSNTAHVPNSYFESLKPERRPRPGDVLYSVVGSFGIPSLVKDQKPFVFQRHVAILRPNDRIEPEYLYYSMKSRNFYHWADSVAIGAAQRTVTLGQLREKTIALPPLPVQRRIAGVLSAYDKLIENNRRQIKLLEEAAQRLYKEWFVDLRFPGHETTPIHNGIPEGWKRTTVGKICELIRDSSRPDDRNESTMYIGLEHMPKNSICLNMYGDVSSVTGSKLNFRKNDILFGKIRPYFHKVGFAQCNGVTSTDTLVMRAKPNCFGLLLEIVSSDAYVAYATATSKTGTKMPRADWNAMSAYELLEPSARVLAQFDGFVKQITDEIMNLSDQIVAAREARDRLLPKLMSGEIEV